MKSLSKNRLAFAVVLAIVFAFIAVLSTSIGGITAFASNEMVFNADNAPAGDYAGTVDLGNGFTYYGGTKSGAIKADVRKVKSEKDGADLTEIKQSIRPGGKSAVGTKKERLIGFTVAKPSYVYCWAVVGTTGTLDRKIALYSEANNNIALVTVDSEVQSKLVSDNAKEIEPIRLEAPTPGNYYVGAPDNIICIYMVKVVPVEQPATAKVFDGIATSIDELVLAESLESEYNDTTKTITLKGTTGIVKPHFDTANTSKNYITVGVSLPFKFSETKVASKAELRFDYDSYNAESDLIAEEGVSYYKNANNESSLELLPTLGEAKGFLNHTFIANDPNTSKENIHKFRVVFASGGEEVIFTVDFSGVTLISHTHEFGEWEEVTAASCYAEGSRKRICSAQANCEEIDVIEKIAHTFGEWANDTATCTVVGTANRACTAEGCSEVEEKATAALGHKNGAWTIKTPETALADGVEERGCIRDCGSAKEEREVLKNNGCNSVFDLSRIGVSSMDFIYPYYASRNITFNINGTPGASGKALEVQSETRGDYRFRLRTNGAYTWKDSPESETVNAYPDDNLRCTLSFTTTKTGVLKVYAMSTGSSADTRTMDLFFDNGSDKVGAERYTLVKSYGDLPITKSGNVPGEYLYQLEKAGTYVLGGTNGISIYEMKGEFHNYTYETTTAATCSAAGVSTGTCGDCGNVVTTPIAKLAHTYGEEQTIAATCILEGFKGTICSVCEYREGEIIAKTAHAYSEWEVKTAATCLAEGSKERACTGAGCTEKETEKIDALGHAYGEFSITTAPTCLENGVKTKTCGNSGCTEKITESVVKDAHTHTVTFMNGETEISKVNFDCKGKAIMPTDPIKDGFKFNMWYKDADCTIEFDFDASFTDNVTVYAKFDAVVESGGGCGSATSGMVALSIIPLILALGFIALKKRRTVK